MARRKGLTLAEVHAALFETDSESEESGASEAGSFDSVEQDAFEDGLDVILDKEVVRTLCTHTNLYAAKRKAAGYRGRWKDVVPEDILHFISLVIYKGLSKTPAARDMWRKHRLYNMKFAKSVMPGYRFEAIEALLHMSNPADDEVNDQLRGQPGFDGLGHLTDQILDACRAYYHPWKNLCVDERVVATKARISMKMYNKDKPSKWGYKLFVLADSSNGYTCDFDIYEGKARTPSGQGLSYDSVVNLLRVAYLGTGYAIYVDNFYTSAKLFLHLHSIGFAACGTIRENRLGFPRTTVNALPKRAARVDMRWKRNGPLLFVKWRDTRDVTMCSTLHKAFADNTCTRRVKDQRTGVWSTRRFTIPEPVRAYNKYMGGVDLSDALIKYFTVTQKTKRWYYKLFLHFVDIAVVNSFIIHKEMLMARNERPLTQKAFREVLSCELADVGQQQPRSPAETSSSSDEEEEAPQGCYPVTVTEPSSDPRKKATAGRRRCVLCQRKTLFMCRSCQVPLCIIVDRLCFTEWHDMQGAQ
ncbi:piggyBac transposable element-derived protein 4-like [Engraulis encrasicolus]|uniref:piggyBac transposable element-derived protein 4-like n=1 Tax=Engraulis encrasicolus TaxID=184585 RepID=UPI002FD34AC4